MEPDPQTHSQLRQLLDSFSADPTDKRVFGALEEHLFLAGEWQELAGVYESRLLALPAEAPERGDLLLRLGALLEERLDAPTAAKRRYAELVCADPRHREGLARLRRTQVRLGEMTSALQVAEVEESLELPDAERSRVLVETAELWLQLDDDTEARRRYDEALRLDPECDAALAGLAALAAHAGDPDEAARLHERRIEQLQGPARVEAMEHLASLLSDADPRVRGLLSGILEVRPERREVAERLIALERAQGRWDRVDELQQQLWERHRSRPARARLALEAATARLDEPEQRDSLHFWLERALETAPDDAKVHGLRARVFRRAREPDSLIDALEQLRRIEGPSPMRELEIAVLHERQGRPERAVEFLRSLLDRAPRDAEALAVLDRCLAQLGDHAERVEVLERRTDLADSDEEFADLITELGDLYSERLDDLASAEELYGRALARVADHATAVQRMKQLLRKGERLQELDAFLESAATRTRGRAARAREWCELGSLRLESRGDAAAARAAYLTALEADPTCTTALEGMRRIARAAGDDAILLEVCERELELGPEAARACELLEDVIETARRAGNLARAHQAAERRVSLEASPDAYRVLAEISRELADPAGEFHALECLEGLLRDVPEERAACMARLGDLVLELGPPDATELAAHWYRESLALAPVAAVRARLGDLYRRTGQLPELAHELRAELAEASGEEALGVRIRLARVLAELGDLPGASEALQPAFEEDPSRADIADLLESFLAEQNRIEDLTELLTRRLTRERQPARRRELAHRQAGLLLDGMSRPSDAVAALRELADPSRSAPLEALFERALEASAECREHETWLVMREGHLEGAERIHLMLRLASLQRNSDRLDEAIGTLRRAEGQAPPELLETVRTPLLALLREHGDAEAQLELIEKLIADSGGTPPRALRIERARLWIDDLGQTERALAELEDLERELPHTSEELQQLAALYGRAGAAEGQIRALEGLAEAISDPEQKVCVLREMAELLAGGPERVRDARRAEAVLRQLLARNPDSAPVFAQLADLFERGGQSGELAELLRERLRIPSLPFSERAPLSLRLAHLLEAAGDVPGAVEVLRSACAQDTRSEAVDDLLFSLLERQGDARQLLALCEERSRSGAGELPIRWLRRWREILERTGAPPEQHIAVVERLVEADPHSEEFVVLRIALLRKLRRFPELGEALESLLADPGPSEGRRRVVTRELLRLYEGPLESPERALALVERELERDPDLRLRGARLAARLGDAQREAALLEPLVLGVGDERSVRPAAVRQLGLALAKLGRDADAEPLLWRVLEADPRDRKALSSLESVLRERDDAPALLRVLEAHFPLESNERRASLAREGLELADRADDSRAALRWIQRLHSVEGLAPSMLTRWVALEHEVGERTGLLIALRALGAVTEEPGARAALLADEAQLHQERGELDLARERYREALELEENPPPRWLVQLDRILDAQGRASERARLLRRLAAHPGLSAEERGRYREARVRLLASHPELREEAMTELRALIDEDPEADDATQIERMRTLLRLYADLERTSDWCALADALLARLEGEDRHALERELARRLSGTLFARDRAVAAWEKILERVPEDREALETLAGLYRHPGAEARLAEVLEGWAAVRDSGAPDTWIEAAEVRWNSFRDGQSALSDLDRALELSPDLAVAHRLRREVCAHLGRADDELQSLRALLRSNPDAAAASNLWLRTAQLLAAGPEREDQAAEAAERALALAADPASIRTQVRSVFESLGSWSRAAELLGSEIEEGPESARRTLLRRLARIEWDERSRAEAACQALEQLSRMDALDAEDYERWADALAHQQRWPEVLERRREALRALGDAVGAEEWLELAHLALDRTDGVEQALGACDCALLRDPRSVGALELRARLRRRVGAFEAEFEDLLALAEAVNDKAGAAAALARAAELARDRLDDDARAAELYRSALELDPALVPALFGAGRSALAQREWSQAERMFERACSLLDEGQEREHSSEAARLAAEAALKLHRNAEAFRYLDQSLERNPENPASLDAMAELGIRLGVYDRARACLEARLASGDLDPDERAARLVRLAQARERVNAPGAAIEALEEVVALRPQDEVSRAHLVDLMERLGETERAIAQLDHWLQRSPPEHRAAIALRATRMDLRAGRRAEARRRLEDLLEDGTGPGEAWIELAHLVVEDDGPEGALRVTERGLACAETPEQRATLLWLQARTLARLARPGEAAQRALETLRLEPGNAEAAQLLAENLGHLEARREGVTQLERVLDTAQPAPPVEAELWEAIGRAYAGPLESIERAQRCYRRALEANPLRASAREALADTTAFEPGAHRESVALHRELLESFPARPGSWRSMARIAEHWKRRPALSTTAAVLAALRVGGAEAPASRSRDPLLIDTGESGDAAVRAANELMQALDEAGALPEPAGAAESESLPGMLRTQLGALAGSAWELDDEGVRRIWSEPTEAQLLEGKRVSRRARRRLARALKGVQPEALGGLNVGSWRAELWAHAASRALAENRIGLEETLHALLGAWPTTAGLDLRSGGDVPAALQLCPPARMLLLRIARSTLDALGV